MILKMGYIYIKIYGTFKLEIYYRPYNSKYIFRARLGSAGPVFNRHSKSNFKHCDFLGPFPTKRENFLSNLDWPNN